MNRIVQLALICAALVVPVHASWSVTNDQQHSCGGTTTCDTTFSNALTNPSVIIALCRYDILASPSTGVTDTAGNSYTYTGIKDETGSFDFRVYIADNTHTTASNVITCTFTAGGSFEGTVATEVTGGSSSIDASTSGSGTAGGGANGAVLPAYSTTSNGDFAYAAMACNCSGFSAGTSPQAWTLTGGPINTAVVEYYIQPSAGSITPTWGVSGGTGAFSAVALSLRISAITNHRRASVILR